MVYPLMGFNPYPPSRERMHDPMLVLNMSIFNSADAPLTRETALSTNPKVREKGTWQRPERAAVYQAKAQIGVVNERSHENLEKADGVAS